MEEYFLTFIESHPLKLQLSQSPLTICELNIRCLLCLANRNSVTEIRIDCIVEILVAVLIIVRVSPLGGFIV